MAKISYKVSYYVLYVLSAVIVTVLALFYFVGFDNVSGDYNEPRFTDSLLYLMYGMLGLCILVYIASVLLRFGSMYKNNKKKAIKSLGSIFVIIAILLISYLIGSDETIMTGEGPYTDTFWLKITDMFIYSIFFLFAITIIVIVFSSIKKRLF